MAGFNMVLYTRASKQLGDRTPNLTMHRPVCRPIAYLLVPPSFVTNDLVVDVT